MIGLLVTSVGARYRWRGMGAALAALYVFGVGAGGGLVAAMVVGASGPRPWCWSSCCPPPCWVRPGAGRLTVITYDLTTMVVDVREEHEENLSPTRGP